MGVPAAVIDAEGNLDIALDTLRTNMFVKLGFDKRKVENIFIDNRNTDFTRGFNHHSQADTTEKIMAKLLYEKPGNEMDSVLKSYITSLLYVKSCSGDCLHNARIYLLS